MPEKPTLPPILSNLNPKQQEAVSFWGKPLLILAGAGSGKTKTLTHRAAWLICEKGIPAENLLLMTFTNKAAEEMKDRILRILTSITPNTNYPQFTTQPYAGTFHSFCARVLRRDGQHIDLPSSFVIYDEQDQNDLVKGVISSFDLVKSVKPYSALSAISQAKNELITPLEYMGYARGDYQKKIAKIYIEYQKQLKSSNAIDFDDLLVETVRLLKNEKEILNKYRNTFQYVLVDEWQDTNKPQYEITKLLTQRDRNLTVVGDASQSIYSWRGANYRNINYLQADFPELKVVNLEQNYRSSQTILDAAYCVISKNNSHPILKLWTDKKVGEKIKLYQAKSELDEASFIAEEIAKLATEDNEIAILYRTNAQSRVIEEALLHSGIPYKLFGGVKFYGRKEIKDVLSFLRLVANPKDTVSYGRAQKLGKGRFSKFQNFVSSSVAIDGQKVLLDGQENSTLGVLDTVLQATSYLELYDEEVEEDQARLENIKELRSVATEFPNLFEFLEQVALVETAQQSKHSLPATNNLPLVTLMTTHSAKGLEFDTVFLVGLEEGLFPHSRSLMNLEEIEEERRLAYVGITRAKEKLYLSFAQKRLIFGTRGSNAPSRFLGEIPDRLLEPVSNKSYYKESYNYLDDPDF